MKSILLLLTACQLLAAGTCFAASTPCTWIFRNKSDMSGGDKSWTASNWLECDFTDHHFLGRVSPKGNSQLVSPVINIDTEKKKTVEVFVNGDGGPIYVDVWFCVDGGDFNPANSIRVHSKDTPFPDPIKLSVDFSSHPGWKGHVTRIRLLFHKISGHVPVSIWAVRFAREENYIFNGALLPLDIDEPIAGGMFRFGKNAKIIPPEKTRSGDCELHMKTDRPGKIIAMAEMNHMKNGFTYPVSCIAQKNSDGVEQYLEARFTSEKEEIISVQKIPATGGSFDIPQAAYRGFVVLCADFTARGECSFHDVILGQPNKTGERKWQASWIWSPKLDINQDCKFTKTISIDKANITKAVMRATCDDIMRAFLNDKVVLKNSRWIEPKAADITDNLKDGQNSIRVECHNGSSKAGLVLEIELIDKQNKSTFIGTDGSWKLDENNDVEVVAPMGGVPWGTVAYPKLEKITPVTFAANERPKGLSYSVDTSLGFPQIKCGDELIPPFLFGPRPYTFSKKVLASGVNGDFHLYRFWHEFGGTWRQDGSLDFTFIDEGFRTLVSEDKNARVYLAFRVTPPSWWIKQHPDEITIYDDGSRLGGSYGELPTFASRAWRDDVQKYLKKFIEHTESAWYADRIIAYMPCSHAGPEWFYDRAAGTYPDYSKPMLKHFHNELRKWYNDDVELLRKSWNDPEVTFETATRPTREEREQRETFFIDRSKSQKVADFNHAMQTVVTSAMGEFMDLIKKETNNRKLTNVYYGYVVEMPELLTFLGMLGHYDFGTTINNDKINGFASPIPYSKRAAGDIGDSVTTLASLRLHNKIWINEADNRSNLCADGDGPKHAYNMRLTLAEGRRDIAYAITERIGVWWYDLGGGWYDNDLIVDDFKIMNKLYRKAFAEKVTYKPQTAIFFDETVAYTTTFPQERWSNNEGKMMGKYRRGLARAGAPSDTYLLSDLEQVDLSQYKVVVFPNAWNYSEKLRKLVYEKVAKEGRTVVWIYAPGFVGENGKNSVENMKRLTGFDLRETKPEYLNIRTRDYVFGSPQMMPRTLFRVATGGSPRSTSLGKFRKSGDCAFAERKINDCTFIYMAAPDQKGKAWKEIYAKAGVHIFCDRTDRVFFDGKFLGVHFMDRAGKRRIELDRQADEIWDVFAREKVTDSCTGFSIDGRPGETKLFYLGNIEELGL